MNTVAFKLDKIKTEQFAVIECSYDNSDNDINVNTDLTFGADFDSGIIRVGVKFQFEQKSKPFIVVDVNCFFSIESNTWNGFENEQQVVIPKELLRHLAVITVGTARGVLHSKTESTVFNEFILPTLNVENMINEDGVFEK